jgi:hypothetical protein
MKTVPLLCIAFSFCAVVVADDGKFTIYMGGKPVASETYTIQKSDGKIAVEGSGKAEIGPMKVDIEVFKVVTDDKYQPVSATAKATLGQIKMAADITFSEGKAHNEITTAQGAQTKEDDVHPDDIVINANLPLFPWSFVAMRAKLDNSDPQEFRAYIIGQAEVPLTVIFKGRENVEFADKKADLSHLSASLTTAQGQTIGLDLWINDDRKIIKLAVPSQNVEAYQDGWMRKAPPETPKTDAAKPDSEKPDAKKKQP